MEHIQESKASFFTAIISKMALGNVRQRVRAQSGLSLHLASVPWALGHRGGSVDCWEEARQITELWSKAGPPFLLNLPLLHTHPCAWLFLAGSGREL